VLKKRPRQGLPHNKEEEAEKGRDRDQVGSLFVHKEASITRDQVGFHCVDEEPSRASNSGLTMWTRSRARASNHLSQGIEAELGLKEVKEATIGQLHKLQATNRDREEESVLYNLHTDYRLHIHPVEKGNRVQVTDTYISCVFEKIPVKYRLSCSSSFVLWIY
jgi:hypothetical protein